MSEDDSLPPSLPPFGPDAANTLATIAPVARQSVVDAVADRLRGDILAGRLRPGTRLPSERELSLALGVNRLTLRASLARLEALGLITTRHGAGAPSSRRGASARASRCSARSSRPQARRPDVARSRAQRLELRRILAAEADGAWPPSATRPRIIAAMAACAQVLTEHVDDPVAFARYDLAFMRAVCKAARNVGLELFSIPLRGGRTSTRSSSRCSTTTAPRPRQFFTRRIDAHRVNATARLARQSCERSRSSGSRGPMVAAATRPPPPP